MRSVTRVLQVTPSARQPRNVVRGRLWRPLAVALIGAGIVLFVIQGAPGPSGGTATRTDEVTVYLGEPNTLDPAASGDVTSAIYIAQLFEGLTGVDPGNSIRPALARSWETRDRGRTVIFHLRPGLMFSDGTPLTGHDVVRSWLRVIDPKAPSPLASLLSEVEGAAAYARGDLADPDRIGLRASEDTVEVRLTHVSSDFPAIAASPTLAIVPPGVGERRSALEPGGFVASGGYTLTARSSDRMTLSANARYWAGKPPITTVQALTSIGGRSPVDEFRANELDYTTISSSDAAWIAFDPTLGPLLREGRAIGLTYYGFDVRRSPFDDPRIRRAFAGAVDWKRIVALASPDGAVPATSMVPPGIVGRSVQDFAPRHDPAAARRELAEAGFTGAVRFPPITLMTDGAVYDAAVLDQIELELGVVLEYESMPSEDYFERLASDPPAFWALTWVADYPAPSDFLRVLLGTDETNNYGRWSSAAFDAAIAEAVAAEDPSAARAAYDRAESLVRDEVPVIPVSYGTGQALAREGLLGAAENGLGILRLSGLAWAR